MIIAVTVMPLDLMTFNRISIGIEFNLIMTSSIIIIPVRFDFDADSEVDAPETRTGTDADCTSANC
jgi:hypothetical protein